MSTQAKWQELRDKTAALSLRERVILAATLVVLIAVLWLQFSFDATLKSFDKITKDTHASSQEMGAQTEAMMALEAKLSNDPNAPLRAEKERLDKKLEQVGQEIETRLQHLVAPERMADLVRQVLSDYKGLTLVSAENLPAAPLDLNMAKASVVKPEKADKKDAVLEASDQAVIFEHGFKLTLKGSYFSALEFVQRLEGMDGFYWRMLDYEVTDYPSATIVIHVSTLSLDKEWIGV
jgi:MSHA biogenesis protein MshJ